MSTISWLEYVAYSDSLTDCRGRVNYLRGQIERRYVTSAHQHARASLGRLIFAVAEEMDIELACFGSMTCRREELDCGLEPDECYWIKNERRVRGRDDIDLDVDPPPDLTLEVEISGDTIDRMSIYAALGVPEVWRWNGAELTVHLLSASGTYRVSQSSKAFPFLPLAEFVAFLKRTDVGQNALIREFRAWVRERKEGWQ